MGRIVKFPEPEDGFALARRTLRGPFHSVEADLAALDVLSESRDWADIDLCRHLRASHAMTAPKPQPRNALSEAQFAAMMQRAKPREPVKHRSGDLLAMNAVAMAALVALAVGALFEMQWTAANYRAVYGVAK